MKSKVGKVGADGKTGLFQNRQKRKIKTKRHCASESSEASPRQKRARDAIAEEEDQVVQCIDGIVVRSLREQELKYLRDLGVYEKVAEREAIAK